MNKQLQWIKTVHKYSDFQIYFCHHNKLICNLSSINLSLSEFNKHAFYPQWRDEHLVKDGNCNRPACTTYKLINCGLNREPIQIIRQILLGLPQPDLVDAQKMVFCCK
jgi:hypothetical protein